MSLVCRFCGKDQCLRCLIEGDLELITKEEYDKKMAVTEVKHDYIEDIHKAQLASLQKERDALISDLRTKAKMDVPPVKDMKYDGGKILAALPFQDFPHALTSIANIGTYGANKYERHSWKTVSNARQRYEDALHRHMLAYYRGEKVDDESKRPHLWHIAWNILAILELDLTKDMVDDPKL